MQELAVLVTREELAKKFHLHVKDRCGECGRFYCSTCWDECPRCEDLAKCR